MKNSLKFLRNLAAIVHFTERNWNSKTVYLSTVYLLSNGQVGKYRCSRSEMFFEIGFLKNFAIFTGKDLELHQGREAPFRVILILWTKLKQRSNTEYAPIPAKSWKPTYTVITNFKAWENMKTLADLSQTKDK